MSLFYQKLALINIKKHSKTYIPYILTCICTIIMYYIVYSLSKNSALNSMSGGEQLKIILSLGANTVGFFSLIFLFYTNSFLIKRRKKEFGLFNILGMEKKHISKIIFFETFYVAIISYISGLLGGILLGEFMRLILLKLLHLDINIAFEISFSAIISTIILFGIIFALTLLNTLRQIHLANPIELLHSKSTGEREPKSKWILAILGVICLGIGYYISLTTESPLDALYLFFVAVILVIIGTYCLFTSISIVVLKLLRKNKNYYYQTRHFTSISGMIYRMKQNAVGLANICILSTAVLVMLSTTVSLYVSMEDVIRTRFNRNIIINSNGISQEEADKLDDIADITTKNIDKLNIIQYRYVNLVTLQNGSNFTVNYNYTSKDSAKLECVTLDEYNKTADKSATLKDDEVLLYCIKGSIPDDTITLGNTNLKIKERISTDNTDYSTSNYSSYNIYYIVVSNIDILKEIYENLANIDISQNDLDNIYSYYYGFDVDKNVDSQTQIDFVSDFNKTLNENNIPAHCEGAESSRKNFYSLYGGLFFLGIFLGLLFIMATVLIIYYKQISEGYDDKERFAIMQKVGMSHMEVKKTIQSQVLTVFFLPLATAVIHIAFAFRVISKLLVLLNLNNVTLFIKCTAITILIFTVFYAIVYGLTARTYYKIVE